MAARRANVSALRVLLVAPGSNLAYVGEEVQRVANALHPQLLFGNVTAAGVLDALTTPFDVVWFACHGTEDGVQLTDGLLATPQLVQMLRQHAPRLVVLNTCNSLQVAMQIHDEAGCAVICTVVSIPDKDAFVTGSSLAHALAAGNDIAQAYNVSKPGRNRQYVLLNGSVRMNGETDGEDTNRLLMALMSEQAKRIGNVEGRLSTLERKVDAGFAEIRGRVRKRTWRHALWWLLACVLLAGPVPLLVSDVRKLIGVEWPFALSVVLAFWVLAFVAYYVGNGWTGEVG